MATPPTDLDLHELVTDVAGFGVAAAVVVSGYRRLRRWLQRPSAPPDPSAGAAPSDSEPESDGDQQYHDALDNPTSDAGPSPSPPPKRARPSPEPALPEQHDARLRHLMGQLASLEVVARDLGLQMELGGLPRVGSQARQLAAHVAEFCQRLRAAAAAMEGMPDDRAMAGLAALVEQSPFALDGLEKWLQHSEADGRRLLELAETHTLTLVDSGRLRGLAHRPDTPHLLVLAADMGGSSRAEELLVQMAEVLGREGALVCVGADHRPVAVRRPEWEPSQMDLQAELDLLHGFGGEGVVSCFLDVTAEAAESLRLHFRVPEAILAAGPAVLWLERGHFIGTLADAMDMIFCDAALVR